MAFEEPFKKQRKEVEEKLPATEKKKPFVSEEDWPKFDSPKKSPPASDEKSPEAHPADEALANKSVPSDAKPSKPADLSNLIGFEKSTADDDDEKAISAPQKPQRITLQEFLPTRVSHFDELLERRGIERGNTILISGGCGTGKSTIAMQSLYSGILEGGERGIYISFEEPPDKLKRHMLQNFGWDLDTIERQRKLAILKVDPFRIAKAVEAVIQKQRGELLIDVEELKLKLPFKPDRLVVDSLSALAVAFMGNTENYRYYIRRLFESLDEQNSINFVLSETEEEPSIYSRTGIEEFLADGVIVLYNLKLHGKRERALEILKMRCSDHEKRTVPYLIGPAGIDINLDWREIEELRKFKEKMLQ